MGKASQPCTLVVIHGVGSPAPGSVLDEVTAGLLAAERDPLPATSEVVLLPEKEGHFRVPSLRFEGAAPGTAFEVNWSDLHQRPKRPLALLRHLLYLHIGLVHLTADQGKSGTRIARLYRWLLEACFVWAPLPALLVLWLGSAEEAWLKGTIAVAVPAFVIGITAHLSKFGRAYRMGYVWALGCAVLASVVLFGGAEEERIAAGAAAVYSVLQSLVTIGLAVAVVELLVRRRGQRGDLILARAALLYVPYIVLSALGAIHLAIGLAVPRFLSSAPTAYEAWSQGFLSVLDYDLALLEAVFAGAVTLLGLLALVGVARYFLAPGRTLARHEPPTRGRLAQDWAALLLRIAPVVLLVAFVILLVEWFSPRPGMADSDVLGVYALSATRIVPYLPFIFGPLAIILDVIGDIVFYLLPEEHPLSIRGRVRERLARTLAHARSDKPNASIVLLAHSQGSVVACDVLGSMPGAASRLVTAGSPLESLYVRFLGDRPQDRVTNFDAPRNWLNLVRPNDYVAGPVECVPGLLNNCVRGGGRHTGYWADPATWTQVPLP